MTNNIDTLINKKRCEETILFAHGESVIAAFVWTYIGYINNTRLILKNVLYVPKFKRSLLSIDNLSEKGFMIIW